MLFFHRDRCSGSKLPSSFKSPFFQREQCRINRCPLELVKVVQEIHRAQKSEDAGNPVLFSWGLRVPCTHTSLWQRTCDGNVKIWAELLQQAGCEIVNFWFRGMQSSERWHRSVSSCLNSQEKQWSRLYLSVLLLEAQFTNYHQDLQSFSRCVANSSL